MSPSTLPDPSTTAKLPGEVDLAQVWTALKRHRRWIVIPTALAFLGSLAFVNVVSPRYTGEAKLLLQSGETFYTRPGTDRASDQQVLIDEQAVASQVQVVMSRDLAREAVKRLNLVGNPDFDPLVNGVGLIKRLGIMLGMAKNPLDRPPEERVLDRYYEHLLVYPVGKSRIVAVEFRSKDPELAANAANTIAELYLGQQEEAKKDSARSASTWLGTNIDGLRRRVAESEAKVEEFRSRTGLLATGGTSSTTLIAQTLADLNVQLAQARTAQTDSQAKAQLTKDMIREGRAFEIPDVANNELIRRLVEQRINLRSQLALELRTLLPGHPRIKELNAQLSGLESQIRGAADRTVRTLENDAKIAGARVEAIQAAIESQKKLVGRANENEVQLRALEREARTQRDQLETYLGRYREATARDSDNAMPPDARIVSRAVAPQEPSFPKKLPTVVLATLAMLVLTAGAIVARELLGTPRPAAPASTPVEAPPMAEDKGSADTAYARLAAPAASLRLERASEPVLAPEPEVQASALDGEALPPVDNTDERFDFDALAARLKLAEPDGRGRRVLVAGVESAADASAAASGLGRMLARDSRVVLVELAADDAATPAEQPGFTDLVAGVASFMDVIDRDGASRLHRVGPGTIGGSLLTREGAAVAISLSAFDQTYDWVICLAAGGGTPALVAALATDLDAAILISNLEPANPDLVDAYEIAREAGARDVIVARERLEPARRFEAA